MTIILCFFAGHDAVAMGTRMVTRRRGQLIADVPAHVAGVVIDDNALTPEARATLIEAILSGIHARAAVAADFLWARVVDVPDPQACADFWASQIGHKYRLVSIQLVLLRGLLSLLRWDKNIGLVDNCRTAWICSTLVAEGLRLGGFNLEDALRATGNDFLTPVRPNDLWWMAKDLPLITWEGLTLATAKGVLE